jgi:ribosomal protein L17
MKHKVKKIKIHSGQDSNQMLIKKMVRNFAASGESVLPLRRAKYLQSVMQTLSHKALHYTQSSKNSLLPYFGSEKSVLAFVETVKRNVKDVASGCVTVKRLGYRGLDAALMARVSWKHAPLKEAHESKTLTAAKESEPRPTAKSASPKKSSIKKAKRPQDAEKS